MTESFQRALERPPHSVVIPAKAGIQYAAASRFYRERLWNTGSPAFAGDDGSGCGNIRRGTSEVWIENSTPHVGIWK